MATVPGKYHRGDVVEVDCAPAQGSEPDRVRPCVIIQNDIGKYSPVTIVATIAGAENVPRKYPVDVPVSKKEGA